MKLPTEMQKFSENNDDALIEAIVRDCTKVCEGVEWTLSKPKLTAQFRDAILARYSLEPK